VIAVWKAKALLLLFVASFYIGSGALAADKKRSFLECFNNPKLCEQEQLVQDKKLRDKGASLDRQRRQHARSRRAYPVNADTHFM